MLSWSRNLIARARRRPVLAAVVLLLSAVGVVLGGWHLWGWYHLLAGQRALERREFPEARAHLDICLKVWPTSTATHFLAARTARRAHLFQNTGPARRADLLDKAEKLLSACQRLGGPAEDLILEQYLLRAQNGQLDDVEKKLLAFVHKDHHDVVFVLEVLTDQCKDAYRLDEALTHLDLWLNHRPDDREALTRKGWVLEHLTDFNGAIDAYERTLEFDPEKDHRHGGDRIRLRLGELLVKKNRSREALTHFEVLYERQPKNPAVLLGLARCRYLQGQPDQAESLLAALLADYTVVGRIANPSYEGQALRADHNVVGRIPSYEGQALGERGRMALEAGRLIQAETWLRQAAKLCPGDRPIVHNLQRCLTKLGKQAEAKKYAARLEQIRADEKRMRQLMQEVMHSPRDAELRFQIGAIFLRNGYHEDGRRWLTMALTYDAAHQAAHQALAEHYEGLGQREPAARHRRALGQPSDNNPDKR